MLPATPALFPFARISLVSHPCRCLHAVTEFQRPSYRTGIHFVPTLKKKAKDKGDNLTELTVPFRKSLPFLSGSLPGKQI